MRENLLSALIIAFVAILAFSDRAWFGGTKLVVSKMADISIPADLIDNPTYLVDDQGVHIPWQTSKAQDVLWFVQTATRAPRAYASNMNRTKPALGYMVREVTFLGMPFGYYTDGGYALFTRSDWGVVAMPFSDEGIALFNKGLHRDIRAGTFYPFWKHFWGWLFVAGVALWGFLQWRHLVRKREAEGII